MINSCAGCSKKATYYWKKSSGEKLDLCEDHYYEMERTIHRKEKSSRLAGAVVGLVSGIQQSHIECPNGKNCKFCKEVNL